MNPVRSAIHCVMEATGLDRTVDVAAVNYGLERVQQAVTGACDAAAGNELISKIIQRGAPSAVAKIGDVELKALCWHLGIRHFYKYTFAAPSFGELELKAQAGVFPDDEETYHRFCRGYLECLQGLDVCATWLNPGESRVLNRFAKDCVRTSLRALEPYFFPDRPWSAQLAGKRVLVIHPFSKSIMNQYSMRRAIWPGIRDVLPDFGLMVLKSPYGFSKTTFANWFAMLQFLEQEMEAIAEGRGFDVALIGCGGASIPLVAYAKRLGKIGIHTGGPTQLLFGIRGGRWERRLEFQSLFNDHWMRPHEAETPAEFATVDNGGYW